MQVLKFVKTNWFSFGIALILVMAVARKNIRFSNNGNASPEKKEQRKNNPERYTLENQTQESASLLGIQPSVEDSRKYAMPQLDEAVAMAFIRRFSKVVTDEEKKFGIPAEVTLGFALVNSFAGQRDLASGANNYFGLPCSPAWQGKTVSQHGNCYRKYETAWESFRDFGLFMSGQPGFEKVKKSAGQDVQKWLQLLENQGVSDVSNFQEEVLSAIRKYRLNEL